MREGFGFGWTNNEGYNNTYDYEHGMNIDVLVMGSSQMEAVQVEQRECASAELASISGMRVYNIGISAHYFSRCIQNLAAAVRKYQPSKYIVMETSSVTFTDDDLKEILSSRVPATERGTLRLLMRKNPYFFLLWVQAHDYISNNFKKPPQKSNATSNPVFLSEILNNMKETAAESGAKIVVVYHPSVSLNKDGTMSINGSPDTVKQFSELCTQNGIYFLDMSNRFLSEYENQHVLPYGFMNTSVGKGHMNRYGHRMFAEEIYKLIQRIEAQS